MLIRELDERLGLEKLIEDPLSDSRQGLNRQFTLADLRRQSVASRLAGYEDLNGAERVAADPTFRLIDSQGIGDRGAALTSLAPAPVASWCQARCVQGGTSVRCARYEVPVGNSSLPLKVCGSYRMTARIEMPGVSTSKIIRHGPSVLGSTRSCESRHSLTCGCRTFKMKST